MRNIDASSIIHAWDSYPLDLFPNLWVWLAQECASGVLSISDLAFKEVEKNSPECSAWLKKHGIRKVEVSAADLKYAQHIKNQLGIKNDAYNPKGVCENDILIIALAKRMNAILITDESRQLTKPISLNKSKMPAVCELQNVDVSHENFLEYIKQSKKVF